jgi:hypothetical protein
MKIFALLPLMLALAACGSGSSDAANQREETVGTEIANDYNRAMDKARNVESLSFEQKDRMDAALEEAEGDAQQKP